MTYNPIEEQIRLYTVALVQLGEEHPFYPTIKEKLEDLLEMVNR